jgi:hypothetical protein
MKRGTEATKTNEMKMGLVGEEKAGKQNEEKKDGR